MEGVCVLCFFLEVVYGLETGLPIILKDVEGLLPGALPRRGMPYTIWNVIVDERDGDRLVVEARRSKDSMSWVSVACMAEAMPVYEE